MKIKPVNSGDLPLSWIRFLAIATLLIGLTLIFAIGFDDAHAQESGFKRGSRSFSKQNTNRQARPQRGSRTFKIPNAKADPNPVPDPKKEGENSYSVGGGPPGGVISPDGCATGIKIDSYSPKSKELVTDFNFPDAEIVSVAKTMGKLTCKNFILDKNVKGRISIISNAPITVADAWKAFLTALDINGYTLVPSGKFIRISRQREARDKQLPAFTKENSPDSDALITRVFQLKYINADEVARTLRSFMPANSRIIPYNQTNTVIVTDTGSNIQKLDSLLGVLDVEGFDAGIEVIRVKHASASELAKLIDTLLPGRTTKSTGSTRRSSRTSKFTPRRTKEGGVINTIIADERTNALIVHANKAGKVEVEKLVNKLDRKVPPTPGNDKIHVVYLQFASAEEISKTLNSLSGTSSRRSSIRRSSRSGTTGSNPITGSLFEGAIRVSADKSTNSLVITASPADFVTIQSVLTKLDIPRDEVYVEAYILEMQLSKDFQVSANVALPTSGVFLNPNDDLLNSLANPLSAATGLVLPFKSGKQKQFTFNNQTFNVSSVEALIKAIQTNSRTNVLATPQILTLDNTKAKFETSERIPIPTSTTTQTGGTTSSVQRESISLSIELTPSINKVSNFVKLELDIQLEDFSERKISGGVQSTLPTFQRKANTTVIVADGDTVVLGGLIRDKITEAQQKIPILGDIPILGWLFRSTNDKTEKTNLMIFITPHIIRQYEKVRALLDKKLKERDDFIEENAGGDDPLRRYRDDMIRSLPKMEELISSGANTSFTIGDETEDEELSAIDAEAESDFFDDEAQDDGFVE